MTSHSRPVVLIPAYNEVETVDAVVRGVIATGLPVVVVDDGSNDGTRAVAHKAGASTLRLPFNLGVGGALRCGFRWAAMNGYDSVVQCDADGQHDPEEIRKLIDEARARNLHLLVGSRFATRDGFQATRVRRVPMRLLSRVASSAAGTPLTDASSGFRVISEPLLSEFARSYPIHYLGDTFEVLVQAARKGYRVGELPVAMRKRAGGTPSAGSAASVRYLTRAILSLVIGSSHTYQAFDASTDEVPDLTGSA